MRKAHNRINFDKRELAEKIDNTRIKILTRVEYVGFLADEIETWLYFFVRVSMCVFFGIYECTCCNKKI